MSASANRSARVSEGKAASPVVVAKDGLDAAKFAAIALMVANHLLLALPAPWPAIGHFAGRPCVALFAFILASRLATGGPERALRSLRRLLIWGVIAQPVYLLLVGGVALRLDVLFTLAAGAGGVWLWRTRRRLWLVPLGAALALANPWLDGGALGAAAVVACAILIERGRPWAAASVAALLVAASNLWLSPDQPPAAAAAFMAVPILAVGARIGRWVPRLPGWAFYAFYPAHLLAIWLAFGPYR
jgi:hypothetical protein